MNFRRLFFYCVLILLVSCKGVNYSFTGAAIDPATKTFSVDFFSNTAPLAPASLSQTFTEKLKDVFLNQTSLKLVTDQGDLRLSGAITGYRVTPVSVQGNEIAAQNKLTITVRVSYVNLTDPNASFERSFPKDFNFDNTQDLSAVEDELIREITDQLTQEIFNAALGNW